MSFPSWGQAFDTVAVLVGRELRIRYKGSWLGLSWALLSPLGTVAVLHVLFTRIVPLDIPHYPAFVYSGILPWAWCDASLLTGATTLFENRDLVRKPFFARPLLPAVVTASNFLLYLLALPILLGLLLFEGVLPGPGLFFLPLVWAVEFLFVLGATVLVSALGVLVRDVRHLLGVVMMLWFYLTPVFYDLERVPPEAARWLRLNPMAVIVEAHRAVTLQGRSPDMTGLGSCALLGSVLLATSLAVFHALEHHLIEEV